MSDEREGASEPGSGAGARYGAFRQHPPGSTAEAEAREELPPAVAAGA